MAIDGVNRSELNRPDVLADLTATFERYEQALLANDVETLIELFWASPRTVRYGIEEEHVGAEEIARYRRSQAVASPPRTLRDTLLTTFGADFGTADTLFVPEGSDLVGRQSQTWVRTEHGWRVVSAHVSWRSAASSSRRAL